jgi:hypothetical protein
MIAFPNPNTLLRGYTTAMLPAGVDGQVAFDTDLGVPVYFFNGAWRLYSDDSIISGLDADAATYIAAVETEDAQALESAVKTAINDFVVGCKADGIWDAIKSSCIMAGARTLSGALVPLKGTGPTNFNFVTQVTTTGRQGLWGMGVRSIWTAIGITTLIRRIMLTYLVTFQLLPQLPEPT